MPSLSYTIDGIEHGGTFGTRVLIGRRMSAGVVLTDPAVSRLHAWIDPGPDGWTITDAGSKSGTRVNGVEVSCHRLVDGDRVRVGHVELRFCVSELTAAGRTLDSPTAAVKTSGILFDCVCGAPLWVGAELAGKRGICRHCKATVTVPRPQPVSSPPAPRSSASKPVATRKCGVCHAAISAEEAATICPDCAVSYHAECWEDNRGCSSYGCRQVGALEAKHETVGVPVVADVESAATVTAHPTVARGPVTLAAAVVASTLGLVAFGLPSAAVGAWAGVQLKRKSAPAPLLWIAIVLSVAGVVAGIYVSRLVWLPRR